VDEVFTKNGLARSSDFGVEQCFLITKGNGLFARIEIFVGFEEPWRCDGSLGILISTES
jgi:hypothetical protein